MEPVSATIASLNGWKRRAPLHRSWRALAAAAAVAVVAMPASLLAASGRVRSVTDGDTFRLDSGERIRIAGIDAPETRAGQAHCPLEMTRGRVATERLRALIDQREVTFDRVGRSYHRTVARVSISGRDLGQLLIARGIARPWPRFAAKPDWCAVADGRTP